MAAHAASRSVPRSPAPREDWLDRAREGLEPIQALTALLQRLTAPGGNVTSTRREKIDRIVRSAIEQHLSGPTFAWFVERDRPAANRRRIRRRRYEIEYGAKDRAASVAMLREALRAHIGIESPIIVLTDWSAGKQYWRHGLGRQAQQREQDRDLPVEVPTDWYRDVQSIVDGVDPWRDSDGSWVFARQDSRRLILRVKGGVAEIFAYYRRR